MVPTSLTVASFNARAGVDGRGRPFDVGEVLESLDADVVAVQETVRPIDGEGWPASIAATLGYRVLVADLERIDLSANGRIHVRRSGSYWWGLALFTRIGVVEHRTIALGRMPTDRSARGAIVADLDNGVRVATVHPSHRVPLALVQLRRLRRALPDDASPTVVLGDMNLWGVLVDRAFPGWERPVRGRSWPSRHPIAQIDHMVVCGFDSTRDATVIDHSLSDHRPIRATLEFRNPAR